MINAVTTSTNTINKKTDETTAIMIVIELPSLVLLRTMIEDEKDVESVKDVAPEAVLVCLVVE